MAANNTSTRSLGSSVLQPVKGPTYFLGQGTMTLNCLALLANTVLINILPRLSITLVVDQVL